ncbi:MAG: histidine--tRNA ligase [Christensenellaceae bacterium]|jgi:histidyl-tRNA synthetase|nr:histidine--tRNA ligase [Christensenellaceae bacterium]
MGTMEIKNLKGVYDYSPEEMSLRNRITDTLRRNFERFGYRPLETATLNYRELLTYKYGDDAEIVREIYKMNDQGERDLGLRFDLTVPFCKYIALNRNLKMPFKRYEMGKVFRNGPVKSGRNREFWQCDVDVVGDGSPEIEAELLALAVKCYTELGIVPQIQIGNRKLLLSLIKHCGATANTDEIIGIIDKVKKVDKTETLTNLSKYMKRADAEKLMQYIGYGIADLEKEFPNNEGIAEIKRLFELLNQLQIANSCVFAPSLARGLNVYTGTVWEVFDASGRYSSSLGGGGRYDDIITNFIGTGTKYPAIGMAFGLEPITAVLSADNDKHSTTELLIVPLGTYRDSNALAEALRDNGVNIMLWTANNKVGKALEYANATAINFVAVIGENETKSGIIKIKNMQTGKEHDFPFAQTTAIAKFLFYARSI